MTIAPPPRIFMCGTASRDARMAGNSVSSKAACQSASVVSRMSEPAARPTLLTRMSRPPKVSTVRSITRLTPSGVDTSACTARIMFGFLADASTSSAASASRSRSPRADAHAAAFGDERARAGEAQPAARAGDNGHLVGQSQVHAALRSPLSALRSPLAAVRCPRSAVRPYCGRPPVKSFSRQSKGWNTSANSFLLTNSRSSGSRRGAMKATMARSTGERWAKGPLAPLS